MSTAHLNPSAANSAGEHHVAAVCPTRYFNCTLGACRDCAECHVACSPPPGANRYPFALGVIEHAPANDRPGLLEVISRALLTLACLGALAAVVGFSIGYLNLPEALK